MTKKLPPELTEAKLALLNAISDDDYESARALLNTHKEDAKSIVEHGQTPIVLIVLFNALSTHRTEFLLLLREFGAAIPPKDQADFKDQAHETGHAHIANALAHWPS